MYLNSDGTYPAYEGGYPIFYFMDDGDTMCPKCANANKSLDTGHADGWHVVGQDVNWEDAGMICCHCNTRIPSAYAEPE